MNESLFMTEFHNQTTLHPLGVITFLILGLCMLLVPRRYALIPLLVLACSVGPAQRIIIATLDFNFLRALVAVGMARVLLRNELAGFRWKLIDTAMILWAACSTITAIILHSTVSAGIYQIGLLYDAIGIYFLCRFLVRDWDDVRSFAQGAAVISVPVVLAIAVELVTARNFFSIFGGVPEITEERFGRLRCQGPFPHPILAGCFWAVLMPFIGALWWCHGSWNRVLGVVGVVASLLVVLATASTTPIGGVLFGTIAALAFVFRRWMSWMRWAGVGGLIIVQLIMTNSIWHLLSRIDIIAGSTAWYRYIVIDSFVRNFGDWWLIGTESYVGWWEWGLDDITNQFVAQGIQGGLLTLLLFVAIILVAFHGVGRSLRREERRRFRVVVAADGSAPVAPGPSRAGSSWSCVALAWAMGVAMFVHCAVFFGVTYFGQAVLVWYLTLGLIGSMVPTPNAMRVTLRARPATPASSNPTEVATLTHA